MGFWKREGVAMQMVKCCMEGDSRRSIGNVISGWGMWCVMCLKETRLDNQKL